MSDKKDRKRMKRLPKRKTESEKRSGSRKVLIETPVDENLRKLVDFLMKERYENLGLDDYVAGQITSAILKTSCHIQKIVEDKRKCPYVHSQLDSYSGKLVITGLDMIPEKYIELAIWGEDNRIMFVNDINKGIALMIDKDFLIINDNDREYMEDMLKDAMSENGE